MKYDEIAVGSIVFIPAPKSWGSTDNAWRPGKVVVMPRSGHPKVGIRPFGVKHHDLHPLRRVKTRQEVADRLGFVVFRRPS